jgi:hypothetical protein
VPSDLLHCCTAAAVQVTKEQYKEMIERRSADLPKPPARPMPVAAPEGEEPTTPRMTPKERMDANWGDVSQS